MKTARAAAAAAAMSVWTRSAAGLVMVTFLVFSHELRCCWELRLTFQAPAGGLLEEEQPLLWPFSPPPTVCWAPCSAFCTGFTDDQDYHIVYFSTLLHILCWGAVVRSHWDEGDLQPHSLHTHPWEDLKISGISGERSCCTHVFFFWY